MRNRILAALAATAAFVSTPASAADYVFSYRIDNALVEGSLLGTLASDQNTFNITGLNYFRVNGAAVVGNPTVLGTDQYVFGTGGTPAARLDKTFIDFTISSGPNNAFVIGVGDRLAETLRSPAASLSIGYGGSGATRVFNANSFQASVTAAVPEPAAWGLMLVGFGIMGAGLRSRRRTTTVAYA